MRSKDFHTTHRKISNELIWDFLNPSEPVKYFIMPLKKAYAVRSEKELIDKLGYLPYTPQKSQQGEKLLIDLLGEVKKDEEEAKKIQQSIKKVYQYLNNKGFKSTLFLNYKLSKGFYLIANVVKDKYHENLLTKEDVCEIIERIGMASVNCEKMLGEVVETLVMEFADTLDQQGILKIKEQDEATQEISALFMQMRQEGKELKEDADFEMDIDFVRLFNNRLNDPNSPLRRIVTEWGNEIYELYVKGSENQKVKDWFGVYADIVDEQQTEDPEDDKESLEIIRQSFLSDYILFSNNDDGKVKINAWALMIFLQDHKFVELKKVSEELYESMYGDRRGITLFQSFKRDFELTSILIDLICNEEFELAKELIELGIEVNTDEESSPLYYAFGQKDKELILRLLKAGAKVDLEYKFAYRLLFKSVFDWNQDEFNILIKNLTNLEPDINNYIYIKEVKLFCTMPIEEVIVRLTQMVNLGIMDFKNTILLLTCRPEYKLHLSRYLRNNKHLAKEALIQIATNYLEPRNRSEINLKDFEESIEFLLRHVDLNLDVGKSWRRRLLIYLSMLGESDLVSNLVNNTTSNDFDRRILVQARDCAPDFKTKNVLYTEMQKVSPMLKL